MTSNLEEQHEHRPETDDATDPSDGSSQVPADSAPTDAPAGVTEPPVETPSEESAVGAPRVFGTPLSASATRVMVLGSGELGKELIIAFMRLGVEVVAVDRYADAPGHQVAHRAEVVDMTDPVALREVIARHRPHYVVPEIEAIATEALAEVEADGEAEIIPTARAVVATMNREGIRRLADEKLGLPTSPYLFADTFEEFAVAAEQIGFPCVVKPVMSSSGKGQSVLHGIEDLQTAWEISQTGGRVAGSRVIIEGFIDFDYEITLLTVRALDPETGALETHFCAPIGHRQRDGDYVESWQPQEMSSYALGAATSIAARIATAMGDGNLGGRGVFGVELFIKGDDVYFSEVSPRPHDTGLVTMATQRLSEFEMHARAVLGLPVDVTLASPGASAVIYGELDEPAIGFENVARALTVPETDVRLFGKPESFARRRMGVVTATADDVATARRRAVGAAETIRPVSARDFERISEAEPLETVSLPDLDPETPTNLPRQAPPPVARPLPPPVDPRGQMPRPAPPQMPLPPSMPPRGPVPGRHPRPLPPRPLPPRPVQGRPAPGQVPPRAQMPSPGAYPAPGPYPPRGPGVPRGPVPSPGPAPQPRPMQGRPMQGRPMPVPGAPGRRGPAPASGPRQPPAAPRADAVPDDTSSDD